MATLPLISCAKSTEIQTKVIDKTGAVCSSLKRPIDRHMNAIIDNGEGILSVKADEVIVTATEVSDAYDASCKK